MKLNDTIHGFCVKRKVDLPELGAVLWQLEHSATGMELVWLERDDENKSFAITFTTLPEDDSGVFHILEHSVLCGSEHYPVKEPFVELLKSSLNTFLNALTFPDKTMYPVSSRNQTDFMNLIRVYLDAVFKPAIYEKPEIFRQEGWHYEQESDGTFSYRGVVFNEMKGAFADADEILTNAMNRALFPDTPYAYVSGGDPAKIPDLSYEAFINYHKRFYSPSNAFVFLDGKLDLDSVLILLNNEYLNGKTNTGRIASSPLQLPINGGTLHIDYELGTEENPDKKYRFAIGYVVGTYADREKLTAVNILASLLCGSNQAPLKRALLDQGFAEDVTLSLCDEVKQPWLCLEVRGLHEEDIPEARLRIEQVLKNLAKGIDASQLEAEIANAEFQMRERDYGTFPSGLVNAFLCLGSWQYGGTPEANLEVGTLFDSLRENIRTGYFENLINLLLLNNSHRCEVCLHPSSSVGTQRRQKEDERIQNEVQSWTKASKDSILEAQNSLLAWQQSTDTPEQLASLPHLAMADIQDMPEELPCDVYQYDSMSIISHRVETNGILYGALYFDIEDCTEEEASAYSLLSSMLGKLSTRKHTASQLEQMKKTLLGSLSFSISIYEPDCITNCGYRCKLSVSFSTLSKNWDVALTFIAELLTETQFSNDSSMAEILSQCRQHLFEQFVMSGSSLGVNRVCAHNSAAAAVREYTSSLEYYFYLKNLENSNSISNHALLFSSLLSKAAVISRCTLSITGIDSNAAVTAVNLLSSLLPKGTPCSSYNQIRLLPARKEGITIPADIGFAVRGSNFSSQGCSYNGALPLAAKIIDLSYLWNVIRVRGGAYGAGLTVRSSGLAACYSYRDPNCSSSLESYLSIGTYLKSYLADNPDLTGYIIGTVSDASPLLSPRAKGQVSDSFFWRGITQDMRCERRHQLLDCTKNDLLNWSDILNTTMETGNICVVGGKKILDDCHLDNIITL